MTNDEFKNWWYNNFKLNYRFNGFSTNVDGMSINKAEDLVLDVETGEDYLPDDVHHYLADNNLSIIIRPMYVNPRHLSFKSAVKARHKHHRALLSLFDAPNNRNTYLKLTSYGSTRVVDGTPSKKVSYWVLDNNGKFIDGYLRYDYDKYFHPRDSIGKLEISIFSQESALSRFLERPGLSGRWNNKFRFYFSIVAFVKQGDYNTKGNWLDLTPVGFTVHYIEYDL